MTKSLSDNIEEMLRWPMPARTSVSLPGIDCAIATTVGRERSENQDRAIVARSSFACSGSEPFLLSAVADGMGGMHAGAECAQLALSTLLGALVSASSSDPGDSLREAIFQANQVIFDKHKGRGGSTVSALLVTKRGKMVVGHVGDSRIYSFLPGTLSGVEQLTEDDTIEAQVAKVQNGRPRRGSGKGQLVQFVGIGSELSPHIRTLGSSSSKKAFAITSDGAHNLPEEMLASLLAVASSADEVATRLTALSDWVGGYDNASVICLFPGTVDSFLSSTRERPSLATVWLPMTAVQITGVLPSVASKLAPGVPEARPKKRRTKKPTTKRGSPSRKKRGGKAKKPEDTPVADESEQVAIEFVEDTRPK